MSVVPITYFTDVLCVWAYVAEARVVAVRAKFGASVAIQHQFCSVFGNTARKIATNWRDKGDYDGFNRHIRHVAERFPHVSVHPDLWLVTRPASSTGAHLFVKAVHTWEIAVAFDAGADRRSEMADRVLWDLRLAFFRDGRDIARRDVQREVAAEAGVDVEAVERLIQDGTAFAALAADQHDADRLRIEGSPSFVLNDGRQKLYGNVGFRIVEANIQELLRAPGADDASWC